MSFEVLADDHFDVLIQIGIRHRQAFAPGVCLKAGEVGQFVVVRSHFLGNDRGRHPQCEEKHNCNSDPEAKVQQAVLAHFKSFRETRSGALACVLSGDSMGLLNTRQLSELAAISACLDPVERLG